MPPPAIVCPNCKKDHHVRIARSWFDKFIGRDRKYRCLYCHKLFFGKDKKSSK